MIVHHWHLKVCVRYFLLNFCFSPNDSSSKTMKNVFLFHLKSSFRSRDIHFFVFLSCPLFLPFSNCDGGCLKINAKVYDVINCLNKNLIIHFVWYLDIKKRYGIETLSIYRVLSREDLYGKIMQKMCTKS